MHHKISIWFVGCLALAAALTSEGLNAAIAFGISNQVDIILDLRILLFVTFGFNFVGIASLLYFTALYARDVVLQKMGLKHTVWITYGIGLGVSVATSTVPGVALIWLVLQQDSLPDELLGSDSIAWIAAWFSGWGASLVLQLVLFTILGVWTRRELRIRSVGQSVHNLDIRLPQMTEADGDHVRHSVVSGGSTLASRSRTPSSSQAASSIRCSSSTKDTATNSRTKLVAKLTPRSSIDTPVLSNGEILMADMKLEAWDSSTAYRDSKSVPSSSPPLNRPGLEPIPGSRSGSPDSDDEHEGLNIILSSPPQALSVDTATTLGWNSSPSTYQSHLSTLSNSNASSQPNTPSSPPSSPPNFSRPTSRQNNNKHTSASSGKNSFSTTPLTELIHPLFRATSPHPPPIAITGTMVTASPIANKPITPKTLARLRTNLFNDRARSRSPPPLPRIDTSAPATNLDSVVGTGSKEDQISQSHSESICQPPPTQDKSHIREQSQPQPQSRPRRPSSSKLSPSTTSVGHWRAMPSIDQNTPATRPSTAGSTVLGSPGPSIVDDEELPPILPGFILGAGSRTSMLGYKERKNGKKKSSFSISFGG